MMNATRNAFLAAASFAVVLAARADSPAAGLATHVGRVSQKTGLRAFSGGQSTRTDTVRVTLLAAVDDYTMSDLKGYLDGIQATQNGMTFSFETSVLTTDNQLNLMTQIRWNATVAGMPEFNRAELAAALSADLKLDPTLPPEKRKAGIEKTQAALYDVLLAQNFLQTLLDNKASQGQESLANRLATLQNTAASFTAQIQTKRSRLDALQRQRDQLVARRDEAVRNDPVAGGLNKIAELRAKKVKLVDDQVQAGRATPQELLDAKLAVAEAELRIAERRTVAAPSTVVASINQIEEEIIKVSVDLNELEAGLGATDKNLAAFTVSNATTQSLATMAKANQASEDDIKAWKMLADLKQQTEALRAELLRLKIVKIEAIE